MLDKVEEKVQIEQNKFDIHQFSEMQREGTPLISASLAPAKAPE